MMKSSLRTKILLSVGIIIFVVLGTSTLVHIRDLKRDYLEAVEWRSEALAQGMLKVVNEYSQFSMNIQSTLESLALECMDIYELNQDNVTHVAVINVDGEFAAHNNRELWNKSIESPLLLDSLKDPKRKTILDGEIYHTFVPIYGTEGLRGEEGVYLGIINIGFPKSVVDKEVNKVLVQSVMFFGIFLILALSAISLLMHFLITNPVRHLVRVGQQLAEGNPVPLSHTPGRGDEVTYLRTSFNQISAYFRDIAEVASHVATGVIASEVPIRSKQDILGKAVDEMLHYLKHIADVAAKVAEGDLTETVFIRSANDAFGRVIQTMTEGLRSLIVQIRSSSEQIASTGTMISSLTERDFDIVERVYTAAEHMTSTMQEIGSSVEEVAHNMGTLSSSVEETSASVSQMAMSITHIASKADALTSQTNQAIASLDEAVNSLEGVVESTDVSKRLSQETIQDALGGQEAVEQVMNSMETIQQTVTTSVDAINRFAQRSRDIDTILDVIREITDQTSLLALNASIIAAQAGTHGRGFAVVADEIRNLANGVGNSTKDISSIIHTLQTDTDMVVQTIHAGAEDVKLGMERTQQAREKLQKITASAQQSSSVVTEIAETLHDLMATSRGLSNAMEQVNIMTNDITAATNEQKASTTQISETTTHINEMASQIQQATTEQLTGVHQLLEATNNVTILIDQNLESSRQVAHTAADLLAQADILLKSVDRFKLKAA